MISAKKLLTYIIIFICCFGGFLACYSLNMTTALMYVLFLGFGCIGFLMCSFKKIAISNTFIILINYIYIIANAIFLADKNDIVSGLVQYIVCPMSFFAFLFLTKKANLHIILKIIMWFALINSVAGLFEFFSNRYIIPKIDAYNPDGTVRICGFTGDFISFAMIIGFGILASLYFYCKIKSKKFLFYATFMLIVLFINRSRGPLVAVLICIATYIIYNNKIKSKDRITRKRLFFIFSGTVAALCLYYLIFVSDTMLNSAFGFYIQRLRSIFVWSDMENDHTNATRIQIWTRSLSIFLDNIWFGTGIGSTGIRNVKVGVTESAILKRLVELGVIGTFLNGLVYIKLLRFSMHNIKKLDDSSKLIAIIFLLFVVMVIIEGLILQIDEYAFSTTFLWLAFAVLCNCRGGNEMFRNRGNI